MSNPIPTTIITGFLGSGKTTIIGHLIDELQSRGEKVAYIKNEIGETDLDAKVMQGKNITTKELLNGCICCTIIGPFHAAMDEVIQQYHPHRIIIEASGTADAAALALTVSTHRGLHRDGVISVIDVVNFEGYKDLSVTAQNQTKFTDLLIFNKIELVDLPRKRAVVGYVRELNTHSPIIEAPGGVVDAKVVFGLDDHDLNSLLSEYHAADAHNNEHDDMHKHLEADGITACTVRLETAFSEPLFTNWLQGLPKNIFRAKGIVHILERNGQTETRIFNMVGGRVDYLSAPQNLGATKPFIICIGMNAAQMCAEIEASLQKVGVDDNT